MKHLLLTTIAAVVLVGCGESQQSTPAPESKPVEPVAGAKAPDISIHEAANEGNIEAVKQHLAAGSDVNAKDKLGRTPLHNAVGRSRKEITELLIAKGADVNASMENGKTPLHYAIGREEVAELLIAASADVNAKAVDGETPLDRATMPDSQFNTTETADLLRKHGGKTGEELKAEGK